MSDSTTTSSRTMNWIEVLVVVVIVVTLIALLVPAVHRSREAARRTQSRNNLKQLGLGFHNYHDVYTTFPPGAIVPKNKPPRWGWTYSIVPFLEASSLYSDIDGNRTWDDVANQIYSATLMPGYLNPSESRVTTNDGYPLMHYTMNSSIGYRNGSLALQDLRGGASNTWLTSEIAGAYRPWAEPVHWRELDAMLNSSSKSLGRPTGDGALIGLADGAVKDVSNQTDVAILKALNGGLQLPEPQSRATAARGMDDGVACHWDSMPLHKETVSPNAKGWYSPYLAVKNVNGKTYLVHYRGYAPMTLPDLSTTVDNYPSARNAILGLPLNLETFPGISRMKNLEMLSVTAIELNLADVKRLKSALPNLRELRGTTTDEVREALNGFGLKLQ